MVLIRCQRRSKWPVAGILQASAITCHRSLLNAPLPPATPPTHLQLRRRQIFNELKDVAVYLLHTTHRCHAPPHVLHKGLAAACCCQACRKSVGSDTRWLATAARERVRHVQVCLLLLTTKSITLCVNVPSISAWVSQPEGLRARGNTGDGGSGELAVGLQLGMHTGWPTGVPASAARLARHAVLTSKLQSCAVNFAGCTAAVEAAAALPATNSPNTMPRAILRLSVACATAAEAAEAWEPLAADIWARTGTLCNAMCSLGAVAANTRISSIAEMVGWRASAGLLHPAMLASRLNLLSWRP